MRKNSKKTIAILFGGASPEYSVSLESAAAVLEALDRDRFLPVMIGISQEGNWYCFEGDTDRIRQDTWLNEKDCCPAFL